MNRLMIERMSGSKKERPNDYLNTRMKERTDTWNNEDMRQLNKEVIIEGESGSTHKRVRSAGIQRRNAFVNERTCARVNESQCERLHERTPTGGGETVNER